MFSQTAEYTLRVVVFLAGRLGQPVTTRQIALATRVPEGYLAKVLQNLSRAGMITSQRGLHGGSVLAKDPATLSVHDVLQSVEPIRRITSCPLGIKSHGVNLCPLHKRLDQAMELVEDAFKQSTIADMLADANPSKPLCETPELAKELAAEAAAHGTPPPAAKAIPLTISRRKLTTPRPKPKSR